MIFIESFKKPIRKIKNFFNTHLIIKIVFLLIPCIYLDNENSLKIVRSYLFYPLLFVSSVYVFIDFFFIKKKKPTKLMYSFLMYYAWVFFRQLIEGLTINDMHLSVTVCTIAFLIETYIQDNPSELVQSFFYIFEPYIYINAVIIIYRYVFFKSKIENLFIAHNRNAFLPYAAATMIISILYIKNTGNSKRGLLLFFTSLCSLMAVKSATGAICAVLILVCFSATYYLHNRSKNRKIRLSHIAFFSLLLNLLFFIYAYYADSPNIIGYLVNKIFHKTPHLSSRTVIWIKSFEMIKEKFLFGYGDDVTIVGIEQLGSFIRMGKYSHPHNALLRILMQFGIVGLVLFTFFSFIYIKKIDKSKDSIYKSFIVETFLVFYIYCIMESCVVFYPFYIMVFLSCHLDDIPEKLPNKKITQLAYTEEL